MGVDAVVCRSSAAGGCWAGFGCGASGKERGCRGRVAARRGDGGVRVRVLALVGGGDGVASWGVAGDGGGAGVDGEWEWVTEGTVSRLCQRGRVEEAVEALGVLVERDCRVSHSLVYAVLKRCAGQRDLVLGRLVHALAVRVGFQEDTFLCNHLIRMYAAHGRLRDAMDVFAGVREPDAFTWSAVISSNVKHGEDAEAIRLYQRMRRTGVRPDGHVFVAALQACARGGDLTAGQQVHRDWLESELEPNVFVSSGLVDMYAKCGDLEEAESLFYRLLERDVVTWNAMLAGYAQKGMGREALRLYRDMQEEGVVEPNSVTFVCVLQACASVGAEALEEGKELHAQVRERGFQGDVVVGGSLVNMYARCGSIEGARGVFDRLGHKNVVTWNAMLAGYSQQGMGQDAIGIYRGMEEDGGIAPDAVTFVSVLQACASVGSPALEMGKQLHAQIRQRGFEADVFVANSLVTMYAKCGSLEDAQGVFDGLREKNVVTWTAMTAGYSQQGMGQEALRLYDAMGEEGRVSLDWVTFVCLLQACASVGAAALEKGKQLHAQIRERGFQGDVVVGGSLVNMYAKCGSLEDARGVFDGMAKKNVVSWNAMLTGYCQQGEGHEALGLYRVMQEEGITEPDSVTYLCLLQACASVAALHLGRQIHAQIKEQGLQADALVAGSLITMYGKSGSMADAQQVFEALPKRDVVTWSALIAGYTRQGDSEVVFDMFRRMKEDGVQPAGITFLSVLTVCSHAGLVSRGREYFEAMSKHYGITPTEEHYSCMVDLLGRAGHLDEALALVRTMPVPPDTSIWHNILSACRKWGNVEVGRHAFHEALKLDTKDPAAYVLMSNIYSGAQMWEQAQEMQERRLESGAWKQPGRSWWTDLDGLVHSFQVGDMTHPESEGIYAKLNLLFSEMKKEGYVPAYMDPSSPGDIFYDGKEDRLCRHTDKVAVA